MIDEVIYQVAVPLLGLHRPEGDARLVEEVDLRGLGTGGEEEAGLLDDGTGGQTTRSGYGTAGNPPCALADSATRNGRGYA